MVHSDVISSRNFPFTFPNGGKQGLLFASQRILNLSILLIILQLIDAVLTSIGVARYGISAEGNPFLRNLMLEWGCIPTLAAVKSAAILAILLIASFAHEIKWIPRVMEATCALYILAAVAPWTYFLLLAPNALSS